MSASFKCVAKGLVVPQEREPHALLDRKSGEQRFYKIPRLVRFEIRKKSHFSLVYPDDGDLALQLLDGVQDRAVPADHHRKIRICAATGMAGFAKPVCGIRLKEDRISRMFHRGFHPPGTVKGFRQVNTGNKQAFHVRSPQVLDHLMVQFAVRGDNAPSDRHFLREVKGFAV